MAFTFPRLAELLLSLVEKFVAIALIVIGAKPSKPQEASAQPYKGTRPAQPRAIAIVWAEAAVDEGAAKQISDILKWCAQEDLKDLCVYDPAGELKAHAEELRRALHCSVEVGWHQDPVAATLLCGACREQAHGNGTPARAGSFVPPVMSAPLVAAAADADTASHAGMQLHECVPHTHVRGASPDVESSAKAAVYDLHRAAGSAGSGAASADLVGPSMCSEEMCMCGGLRGPGVQRAGISRSDAGGASGRTAAHNGAVGRPATVAAAGASGPLLPASGTPAGPRCKAQGPGGQLGRASQPSGSGMTSSPSANGLHGASPSEQGGEVGASTAKVRVRVLSASDAYSPVLEAARSGGRCAGCGEVLPLQGGPYREGLARLRGQLQQLAGEAVLIQPELVLVVGPALTLAGYPPFQVAASEILHVGPAAQLCRSKVDVALAKYFRTEQRFGS